MSKKANPAAIGIFVVGAIILAVVAIMMFGSGKFFSKTQQFILYCEGSVNGLDVGAPVKFKGVKIGQVSKLYIRHHQIEESVSIPVIIEIDTQRLQDTLGVDTDLGDESQFNEQISFGLRARLQQASYVTGLLYVELDYYPDAGAPQFIQDPKNRRYLEIPTIDSEFTEVFQTAANTLNSLSKINFARIGRSVEDLLEQLNTGLREIEFDTINKELVGTLENANQLLANPEIPEAISSLKATLDDSRGMINHLDSKIDPLIKDVELTTAQARSTLASFQKVGDNANALVQPDAALIIQVEEALQEISDAARAVRLLSEFIERNPSAFLTGKQAAEK